MPFVDIKILKGRTPEQKRNLVTEVTRAVSATIDVPTERIWVHVQEMEKDGFAVGGQLAVDWKK